MRGRNLGIAIGTTLALLLAGCGGGTGNDTTTAPATAPATEASSEQTTATTEPSPEPTPEESPSTDPWAFGPPRVTWAMSTNNEEGAIAFVEYYVQLANYGLDTLDPEPLKSISDINCVGCQSLIENIISFRESGYRRVGGWFSIGEITETTAYPEFGLYRVELHGTDAYAELLDADGAVIQTADALTSRSGYTVEYVEPYSWQMVSFGNVEASSE